MPRPKGQSKTRQNLINAARDCFIRLGYERVSTRKIAKQAGVDAAMIRYYFGSKVALFEAMVLETMEPILDNLKQSRNQVTKKDNPYKLMTAYYRIMASHPELPQFLLQVMNHGEGDEPYEIMSKILDSIQSTVSLWLYQEKPNWSLKSDIDPNLARLSMISLMVFPMIAPHTIKEFGIKFNEEWLDKLAKHNYNLLKNGMFLPDDSDNAE